MSEIDPTKGEQLQPAEAIGGILEAWLVAEAESFRIGKNAVLDNLHELRRSLRLTYDHQDNQNAAKNEGHYNRLGNHWTPQFVEIAQRDDLRTRDFVTARQLFGMQMYASGMYRISCAVRANTQEQYETLRFDNQPTDIDITGQVRNHLAEQFSFQPTMQELYQAPIPLDDLVSETLAANGLIRAKLEALHNRNRQTDSLFDYLRFYKAREEWLSTLAELQAVCINVSANYILYAAQMRGGELAKVPMLQPKSISEEPQVRYPFAGEPLVDPRQS